ncbi:MAG: Permeases of the major facilitator superfamily protein [Candidatus Collierbacteria bacterium GW2011_GWB1_45_35]|uniref:Permeases of the major facilitator superfamily protein n=2 Tax=Candidatus Collieribacteriota TaxID=1752725 RepID=A0A837IHB7_9BACT|nr:MAG: Permeases of the major facilitator superfamily protein [Microgenomates group bacterium GW2011_GWC1_44_23]KKT95683.1 MAG: Permeases of the major facilitator superfamily protein [Candidatus Collierbacteria bacterium GW2011_GWA1_45_15]KKU00330.1 MAG: Permeases of the major facilitator superfamily protein [Candidatus Collierbacteria bacterium GW2011_GWB2_45_17]KKU04839.1 MAG: Permeases of the major facilitator superfamily protein [Candidatus Collierbacteria bacterium GW2011_GWB1_45_35]KKU08
MLFWCRFFIELNALQAIIQLFYLHRGVSMSQIFYLGIAWSIATIIFDIPTSMIADKWGRKKTIVLGVVINIFANLSMFFGYGFIPFFINTFLLSVSFSFFSGIEDAFLFDTLKEMKQEGVVLKTSGKYGIAAKASKIVTPLFGVLIAGGLTALQFNLLLGINLISSGVALVFGILLVEPKRHIGRKLTHLRLLKETFSLLQKSPLLRTFAFNKTFIFIASFVFWKYYQKPLTDMGISVLLLGFLYPIFNSVIILIYSKAEYIFNRFDKRLIFEFPIWVTLICSLIFAFSTNKWLSYFVSIFLIFTGIIRDPFFNQQVQWRLKSQNRSTTGSVMGLFKSFFDIPILLLSGYLASFGSLAIMSVPALLSIVTLIFFRINSRDILLHPIEK